MGRYRYSSIYIKDEEAYEKAREFARSLGVSLNDLVNAFFRALVEGSNKIRVDLRRSQINIGALQVAVVQQKISSNTDLDLKVALREISELLRRALQINNIHKKNALIKEALSILKKIEKQL